MKVENDPQEVGKLRPLPPWGPPFQVRVGTAPGL